VKDIRIGVQSPWPLAYNRTRQKPRLRWLKRGRSATGRNFHAANVAATAN